MRTSVGTVALVLAAAAAVACGRGRGPTVPLAPLRDACPVDHRWDGKACVAITGGEELQAGAAALMNMQADAALVALDRAAAHPLDHSRHVMLWEQRGLAHAYLDHEPDALAAFDTLLALDPDHIINYKLTTKATFLYQQARDAAAARGAPRLEVKWRRDQPLGEPVPLELETVADPSGLLRNATIYVRTRGERRWRAADVTLAPPGQRARLALPGLPGRKPRSLEIYAVASDGAGNEVLTWSSAARPSEIALRYDPPWYRTWWVWAIAGGVVAAGTGVAVYGLVWEPGGLIGGDVTR